MMLAFEQGASMEENKFPKTRDEWFTLIAEQTASGLSQAAFCRKRQVALWRFSYYKKLRVDKPAIPRASFSPVVMRPSQLLTDVKVELPNGFCCHVPVGMSTETLKQLVSALLSC